MKFFPILLVVSLLGFSCERHDFVNEHGTGTKQLNESHTGTHSPGDSLEHEDADKQRGPNH